MRAATNDANMYLRDFPFNSTVAQLIALGIPVPVNALPSASYLGPDRLFVRTGEDADHVSRSSSVSHLPLPLPLSLPLPLLLPRT